MNQDQQNEVEIALNLLRQAATKEQKQKLLSAIVLVLLGIILLIFFFEKNTALSIAGLLAVLFGIQFAYQYFRYPSLDKMPLFHLLKYKTDAIVWVYSVITERMPFGFKLNQNAIMYFKLIDGDDISLSVPSNGAKTISNGLNHLLPHATFGFTQDREQWYMAAPEMLLKEGNTKD